MILNIYMVLPGKGHSQAVYAQRPRSALNKVAQAKRGRKWAECEGGQGKADAVVVDTVGKATYFRQVKRGLGK